MVSQPTLSCLKNSLDKHAIFELCYAWVARYVRTLKGRKRVITDIDSTDDPTQGHLQLSMFNGYYGHFMYNKLFFLGRDTECLFLVRATAIPTNGIEAGFGHDKGTISRH